MNSMRITRAAARIRPAAVRLPLQRRGYADAVADKIKLTLALPHQVLKDSIALQILKAAGSSSSLLKGMS